MERYEARFWRNSMMTSFAGSKSWNFCGRRGVNSSTALRTVAGSNVDIGWNGADVNGKVRERGNDHDDTEARTIRGLFEFTAEVAPCRGFGRGQCGAMALLRIVCARSRCLAVAS